ncbi:methionine adenosyltransferase [Actibacterium sp. MT2.3-13A]|uniref:methionine adenosyltransferase n=1 Tax=Actibacterium sp. MT2.3-13A TaxID=2828332 RepID=UPI001BAB6311|nr:methionine adenosyltransferase [Actibacterium sp. MT2.3-13A]
MDLTIGPLDAPDAGAIDVEIAERKGLGHPDSICDALAEEFSLALCRFYEDRFGHVLHHNVDKALLWGGAARPCFGGGEVARPFEVFVAGRATSTFGGVTVPVAELFVESARDWLRRNMHGLDADRHARFHALVRPGSADLAALFLRQHESGAMLANDSSVGVGYAPLSALERVVLEVEGHLNAPAAKSAHPEIGEDIKVMGVRRGDRIDLTLSCAFIGAHVADIRDYAAKRRRVADIAGEVARRAFDGAVSVRVNAADDLAAESVFLTVTGTSAEAGDDGEAGRGNRMNGLITPGRPMTIESAAGKNPITHVGKLYNLVAGLTAAALVEEIAEVEAAQCSLVSQIGRRLNDPQVAHVRLRVRGGGLPPEVRRRAGDILADHLSRIGQLWPEILSGRIRFNRWPLRDPGPGEG